MQAAPRRTSAASRVLLIGSLALLGPGCARAADPGPGSPADRPPNVVVIFADDLGYGDLSIYGQTDWRTPAIDRLARQGARLTDFYVPAPYCAPSRAALLTGRYPFRNGLMRNPAPDGRPEADSAGLAPSEVLLSEILKGAGYATATIGKWHLGHQPEFHPRRQGFDEYYGILYSNDMRPVQLLENESVVEDPVVQATLTRRYTERALEFIDRNRERPFFLYLAHAMPHKPLAVSRAFYTPETPGDLYADVMRELDWSVGQVVDRIDSLGLGDHTLVIFLSDNGPWFGGSSGGLRGMKGQTWEGGVRVPFIARWPSRIPAGHVSGALAASIDVFPTVLEAAGARPPSGRVLDGKDLMPVLTGDAPSPHEAVYTMAAEELRTVRSGPWKLHVRVPNTPRAVMNPEGWADPKAPDGVTILAPYEQYPATAFPGVLSGDAPGPMMLFDLRSDPAEQHDLAAEYPEIVRRLQLLLEGVREVP